MTHKPQADVKLHIAHEGLTTRHIALLALLMVCGFIVVGQLYVTIPLGRDIASRFAIAPSRAPLSGTAFGLAYAAGFLIFGPLSDRFGRKRMILISLAATALATLVVGIVTDFTHLLCARAVQGLAASIFPPAALSLVTEELPADHRPLGVSLMSFAFLGAAPVAQMFAAGTGSGLPTIMFQIAPLYILGALGIFFAASAGRPTAPPHSHAQTEHGGSLLQNAGIVTAWLAAVTVLFGFVSFYSGVQVLGAVVGVDPQALRLAGLPPLLLTLGAAFVTRKYGGSVTARLGMGLAALGLAVATLATPAAFVATSVLLSGGVAFAVPGLIATVASRAMATNRGRALAVYTFALFVGASVAPPAAQSLISVNVSLAWLVPAALLLLAVVIVSLGASRPSSFLRR